MSIRIKVFLIITAIILVITASSVVISVSSAQSEIIKTLENGMQSVASVANEYLSSEVDLLLRDAATVVEALKGIPIESMHGVLIEQLAAYSDTFSSITIFNAAGNVDASYGRLPTPREMALGEYGQQAFEGRRVISTTRPDTSGNVGFHVFVPMDESSFGTGSRSRIVALTVPGVFFSEKVNQFRERTGNIAIVDREGTIVANKNYEWVMNRQNFLGLIQKDSHYADASKAFNRMLAGETGAARFYVGGGDAVTAFMPISGGQGWYITVTALVAESAFAQVRTLILISGFIFMGLGMLAAAFASGSIAKPFYEIRKKNIQLTELGEALQAAQVAKTNFLANMSYDMRTPLNAVIGLSELSLTKKSVPQDVKGYLNRIYGSGLTLMEVVSDLLDISNMESGKFGIMAAEYDLPLFINDVVKANADHIGSKPIEFKIVPEDRLPARLIGDSLRIRQVFNNLLNNAFRYTSVGSVEWRLSTEREGDDTVWLVSSISDTGVGIKPENIDKLFRDYNNRLDDDARVRNLEGGASGLGLTLIKKIVDLMDGTISVESTWGKGSTFTVRIKQKFVSADVSGTDVLDSLRNYKYVEKKGRNIDDIQRAQLPKAKVLVVDDVEMNLEIAQGMMEPYGMKVDCLLNAQEAVEAVRRGDVLYEAIFISRWMSELDGKEAVRIIRNEIGSEYAKTVPIIALTTNTVIGNKDIFHKWGFQDVLSKPLDIRHLDEVINTWIVPRAKK